MLRLGGVGIQKWVYISSLHDLELSVGRKVTVFFYLKEGGSVSPWGLQPKDDI